MCDSVLLLILSKSGLRLGGGGSHRDSFPAGSLLNVKAGSYRHALYDYKVSNFKLVGKIV